MQDEFLASRTSFLPPIPELALAADLLALAAESLLASDEIQARAYIDAADMPTLRAYTDRIALKMTREIHRLRHVSDLPVPVATAARRPRQPSESAKLGIYRRDGFRCRYCGCRIVSPLAQGVISALLPRAVAWGTRDIELNAAFYTLKGVLDHVVPYAHGGTSDPGNVVVSCQPCNYGKGNYFLQQLGLSDPRHRPPRCDDWDGLLRVLPLRPARTRRTATPDPVTPVADRVTPAQTRAARPVGSIDEFASSFSFTDRQYLERLLRAIEASGDLGASYTLRKKVLMVKVTVRAVTIDALGIEPDTTVQVPWSIGPHKRAFRSFAETLAAALPDGTAYETEKMWRVHCSGRLPRISDLMQCPEALRAALEALWRSLNNIQE